jgi:hypothetical protein
MTNQSTSGILRTRLKIKIRNFIRIKNTKLLGKKQATTVEKKISPQTVAAVPVVRGL